MDRRWNSGIRELTWGERADDATNRSGRAQENSKDKTEECDGRVKTTDREITIGYR